MKQEDWRGEFESQFAASKMADPLDMNSEILISPERFASDATPKLVIRFIQSLLDQQKRELLEKRTLLDTSNINPPWFH